MANEFVVKNGLLIKNISDPTYAITIGDPTGTGYRIPKEVGIAGEVLLVDGSGDLVFGASPAGGAAGSTSQLQYNNGGTLAGDTGMTTDGVGGIAIAGDLTVDNINIDGDTISSGGSTNADIVLAPAGTGQVLVPSGYNVVAGNSLVTKDYADALATPPGGSNFQLQYNNAGVFAGDSGMTTDGSGSVNITGDLSVDDLNLDGNTLSSTQINQDIILLPDGLGAVSVAGTTDYELNVTNDDDIPNKKYVDDQIALNIGAGVFSGALVSRATTLSIPNNVDTTIVWDATAYDTDGYWAGGVGTSQLVIPSGVSRVRVSAGVSFQTSTFDHDLIILKNGVEVWIGAAGNQTDQQSPSTSIDISASTPVIDVVAGDFFEVRTFQNSGAPANIVAQKSWFSVEAVQTTVGSGGSGTVTSVNTGDGLAGGPITTAGVINLDFGVSTVTAAAGDLVLIADASDSNNVKTVDLNDLLTAAQPGGTDTQIQYNNGGVLGGDSGMTTDGAGNIDITGSLDVDDVNIDGNQITSTGGAGLTLSVTGSNASINLDPNGTGTVNVNNSIISNVADPVNDNDAANKQYVDSVAAGLDPKESVRVATTGTLAATTGTTWTAAGSGVGKTLTADTLGSTTIDGIALNAGDRVLVKNEASPINNGIYVASNTLPAQATVLTRATDQDGSPSGEVSGGNFTFVEQGTANIGTGWVVVHDGMLVVDVQSMNWTQFSESTSITAGDGLTNTGGTFDVNVSGVTTIIDGSDNVVVGSTTSHLDQFLAGAGANTESGWAFVTQLRDTGGDIGVEVNAAVAGSTLQIDTTATEVTLSTTATNADIALVPDGTGLVQAVSGYDMSTGPDYAFATKGYVDSQITASGDVTDATNLTGDEGLFVTKNAGVLEFKSLSAGDNIVLSSTGTAVTIAVEAAGTNTQIQYNNGDVLAGDTGFTTDGTGSVDITGDLDVDNLNLDGNTLSSTDTDGDIILAPDGTGLVLAPSGYDMSTAGNNAFATKGYVDGLTTPPGGSNTHIQYNDNGSFGGDGNFTTDGSGNVDIVGTLDVDDINLDGSTITGTGGVTGLTLETSGTDSDILLLPQGTGQVSIDGVRHSKRATATLLDASSAVVLFTYAGTGNEGTWIDYVTSRNGTARMGTLHVAFDGTNVSISDVGSETADTGVTFTATNSSGTISIRYSTTTTGNNANFAYSVKQMSI